MKYPNIAKLGLGLETDTEHVPDSPYVWADDLEALLENAQTVYGEGQSWHSPQFGVDTMSAKQSALRRLKADNEKLKHHADALVKALSKLMFGSMTAMDAAGILLLD